MDIHTHVVTHEEWLDMYRQYLADLGVTWTELRDSMRDCGCHSTLGQDAADLWWLYGIKDYPELAADD